MMHREHGCVETDVPSWSNLLMHFSALIHYTHTLWNFHIYYFYFFAASSAGKSTLPLL